MSFVMATGKTFRRLNLRNAQRQRITRFIFYLVGAFGTAAMLLQLYNISSLAAFWPFFAGIVLPTRYSSGPICPDDSSAA
jgi:hypothetical protein